MKMFRIPYPWDFHGYGGYIVLANDKEQAIEVLGKYLERDNSNYSSTQVEWDKVEEVGPVYEEAGCDC